MTKINRLLEDLANILESFDMKAAKDIRKLKKAKPQVIANDLFIWGGAGSIMDQDINGCDGEMQSILNAALYELGKELINLDVRSKRIESRVEILEKMLKINK